MNILFVCTGNTCRSPMAQVLAEAIFKQWGVKVKVRSAGVMAGPSSPASRHAQNAMENRGLDLSNHRSTPVDGAILDWADLILTMGESHKVLIARMAPHCRDKLHTLLAYAGETGDVADPFGQDLATYEACAQQLHETILKIKDRMTMLAIGCDHGGYALKQEVVAHLNKKGIPFKDFGVMEGESADYPIYARKVAKVVLDGTCTAGILLCGTGIGISIAANRFKGIRCALCHDVFSAKATREHNDANILALGGRVTGPGLALEIVDAFLETPFSQDERHERRIALIEENEGE